MNIISRIFCYPLLEKNYDERGKEIERLRDEVKDWQNKLLNREGFTPLGEEKREAQSGHKAENTQFDFTPLVARKHKEWDEEEAKEYEQYTDAPGLPPDEQEDILAEARSLEH